MKRKKNSGKDRKLTDLKSPIKETKLNLERMAGGSKGKGSNQSNIAVLGMQNP